MVMFLSVKTGGLREVGGHMLLDYTEVFSFHRIRTETQTKSNGMSGTFRRESKSEEKYLFWN